MPTRHEKATPIIQEGKIGITGDLCSTSFDTTSGTKGKLYIGRCIDPHRPINHPAKFCYCAGVTLNYPGMYSTCGAINMTTGNLEEIHPWITTTTKKCSEQLRLKDDVMIKQALADLAKQFQDFLPTLRAEDQEVKGCIARVSVVTAR